MVAVVILRNQQASSGDAPFEQCSTAEAWELVERARGGDEAAFAALYASYADPVFSYVLVRIKNWANAEEITSETFLRAFRAIDSLTYRGTSFRAWVMTIARNLVFDHTRSARRRYEVLGADSPEPGSAAVDPATAVCERMVSGELQRGMSQLTADQRQCLELRFYESLPVAHVARRMRRAEGSVRALQKRAVRKLASFVSLDLVHS